MISDDQRGPLYKLGYNDKQIDKMVANADKIEKVHSKKKKEFVPTYKKHLRINDCQFCRQTSVEHMVLKEVSYASWVGSRVSKKEYSSIKGFRGKPSRYKIKYCDLCDEFVRTMPADIVEAVLMGIINEEKGVIVC